MLNSQKFSLTVLLFLISTNAFALSFDISGKLISGGSTTNNPHNIGTIGTFGEAFTGTINIDTNDAITLWKQDSRAVYKLNAGSFSLQFPESNLSYGLTTNGSSSYLLFEIWDNYGSSGHCTPSCVYLRPQDRYRISFINDSVNIFNYEMQDSPFTGGIDTSIINNLDMPTSPNNFSLFDFHSMSYFSPDPNNWGITGFNIGMPNVTITPEPSTYAVLLAGISLLMLRRNNLSN